MNQPTAKKRAVRRFFAVFILLTIFFSGAFLLAGSDYYSSLGAVVFATGISFVAAAGFALLGMFLDQVPPDIEKDPPEKKE